MKVILRLDESFEPMIFNNIKNCYTKGPMYCMRLSNGDTLKWPLLKVFNIAESGSYSSQSVEGGSDK